MKSRVHPKYERRKRSFRVYRVGNWTEYDRALVQRGDITLWISTDAIDAWKPAPSGRRGGQRKFSDHAIGTALILRLVLKLPLRQAEGFLRSVLSLMGVDLEAPDHTTVSRRSQHLDIQLACVTGGRGKRAWKKLHLGVDESGVIVAEIMTGGNADDAKTGLNLIADVEGDIASFTGDAAYDTTAIYDSALAAR